MEKEKKLLFLDVLLIRNAKNAESKECTKRKFSKIYLNWKLFSPNIWKAGTLITLIKASLFNLFQYKTSLREIESHKIYFRKTHQFSKMGNIAAFK